MIVEEITWSPGGTAALLATVLVSLGPSVVIAIVAPEVRLALTIIVLIVGLLVGSLAVIFHRLRVTLDQSTLTVGFGPFRERLPVTDIIACTPTTYRWLAYGGWGIRYNLGRRSKMYNVIGDHGRAVDLTLHDGRHILFSSHNPDATCATLRPTLPNCR